MRGKCSTSELTSDQALYFFFFKVLRLLCFAACKLDFNRFLGLSVLKFIFLFLKFDLTVVSHLRHFQRNVLLGILLHEHCVSLHITKQALHK